MMNDVAKLDREAAHDILFSRATIQDLLSRYSRGLDRCDGDILKSLFWPDGRNSLFDGTISELADYAMATLRTMERTMHMLGTCIIDFDDADHARSETYIVAWHDIKGALGDTHLVAGGRYLDKFERRSGEWRFLERTFVADWHQIQHSTMDLNNHLSAQIKVRGDRFPNDPAYAFLNMGSVKAPAFS
jgi:hypothetical protein